MMAMLKRVIQILLRLSPLAPWRLLRTLDEVRELPALRTQVKQGLKETKRLKKQILELQRRLDAAGEADTRRAESAGGAPDPDRAVSGDIQE